MPILGPSQGESRYFLFFIFIMLACTTTLLGKKPTGSRGGNLSAQLAISSAGPGTGSTAGGTTVTISGSGFTHSASVVFGGAAATSVTYISSTELQATTPAHASGTVSVAVTENPHNQTAILSGGFTYSDSINVSGVSPTEGPTSGGTVVTIKGTGFQSGAIVKFGSAQSTAVTVASSTEVDAMSPAETSGTVAITVTDPNSQSSSLPSAFTYTSGPSVSSISPTSGPVTGGTVVTILGNGFESGATVTFGTAAATSITFVSSTEIRANSPSSTAGTVSVAVTNPDSQTGTLSSAFTFFHTVSLSWKASSSTVAGYNIYRSSTSGGPYTRINSTLDSGTTFTDNNVQAGQTYFYVATAVNSNNTESGYSNQAEAIVPSP